MALGDCTKSLREQLPTCVFSVPESLSSGKITLLLQPCERLYPARKIWEWIKQESIPPFITPAPEDGDGLRMTLGVENPSLLPCLWMAVETEAPSANTLLWKNRRWPWPSDSTNGEERCPSIYEQNNSMQQQAAKALQQHGYGKGCKGLAQPRPPGWSCLAVWINGSWSDNIEGQWG